MAAALDDATPIEHENLRGMRHGRESVGDNEHRTPGQQALDGFLYKPLVLRVERRRRLIEDQQRWVHQQCTRDGDTLPLATGEPSAPLAEYRVVTLRELRDELVRIGRSGRGFDLRLRKPLRRSVRDVGANGVVEQHRVLTHDPGDGA